jgi:hypothetical protein
MGKRAWASGLSLACLLIGYSSLARGAESAPSPDAALPPQLAQLSEQQRLDWMAQPPREHAIYQPMEPEVGIALGVFFGDFALRMAETMLALVPWIPLPLTAQEGGVSSGYVATAGLISAGIAVTAPLLNAVVTQAIANGGPYRRPFVPILVTSYVSCLTVDALTIALALTLPSGSAAGLVYFFGSMAGSISMAIVQNAVREPLPEGTTAQAPPPVRGVAFAF